MTATLTGYSVHVGTATPDGAADLTDDTYLERLLDDLVDLLAPYHGSAAAGPTGWAITLSVDVASGDPRDAAVHGHDLAVALADKAGLPHWPVVRVEAIRDDELDRDLQTPTMPELLGPAEVADLLRVSRQRVHQLNDTARRHATFPRPLVQVRMGPLWDARAIRVFDQQWDRRPGRPAKTPPPSP